tara:strand:- start:1889 stop:2500 length:612 start_codon:yes stop_codon:yes gene_type:complete
MKSKLLKQKTRTNLINYLIDNRGFKSYLEIGVQVPANNYDKIICEKKCGVDPAALGAVTHPMTSDKFFQDNIDSFDIIFIDGLHLSEQVAKDADNGLKCLNKNGVLVFHDCMPKMKLHAQRNRESIQWNGDVWKAAMYVRMNYKNVNLTVLDMDYGCGVLETSKSQKLFPKIEIEDMTWEFYEANKVEALNIMSVEEWLKKNE